MKSCPMCGTDADDEAGQCAACHYHFKGPDSASASAQADSPAETMITVVYSRSARPTGEVPMTIGWLCCLGAVILVLVSFGQGPQPYEVSAATSLAGNPYAPPSTFTRVADAYARQWYFQLAAGGLLSLGVILCCVGYIVRAISFLPGKGDPDS